MSKATIVGIQHDNLREIRLKLAGAARAHHYGRYPDTTEPAILEADLSSEFGAKYAEAKVWAGDYQLKRKPRCPGKDVTCTLTANQQGMLAASIQAIRSAAEDQYYTLELAQLPIFLAQLSCSEDVSDNHLQSLIGAADGNRRARIVYAGPDLVGRAHQAVRDTSGPHHCFPRPRPGRARTRQSGTSGDDERASCRHS